VANLSGRILSAFAIVFSCASSPVFATNQLPPKIIQEPVFGLRYELAKAKLTDLPREVQLKCPDYAGTARWVVGRLYIFAETRDANQTYYVVGGYAKRRTPNATDPDYQLDTFGEVIAVEGKKCESIGAAREVFEMRRFNEISQPVVQQLADSLAVHLVRASGSPAQLREHFRIRGTKLEKLPEELHETFKVFLPK
jgi:hypothetical protein